MTIWSPASGTANCGNESYKARMFVPLQEVQPRIAWLSNCICISMGAINVLSTEKQLLLKGAGVAIGECVFGLSGPFLFDGFGLNIPEGAAIGAAVGAFIGYGVTDMLLRYRNRKYGVSTVPELTKPDIVSAIDDMHTGGTYRTINGDVTKTVIEKALTTLPEYRRDRIRVEVRGPKVVLKGTVGSWIDEAEAERIAFDAPGIQEVENRLQIVDESGKPVY